ncbi:hypothetical protein B296_00007152 [Ensete ventricosum]|uniref:Uncharacterized protein n=1 Tax=Ensete ventricosum TaxID=4639 RepID=A0A427B1U7_ENSVE|nr:hypothetical protein B296_00007152 [Ensete ventricosum]
MHVPCFSTLHNPPLGCMKPASSSAAEDAIAPRFIRLAGAGRTTYHFPLPRPSHRKAEEAASLAMPMLSSVIKDWMRWLVDQRTSKQGAIRPKNQGSDA